MGIRRLLATTAALVAWSGLLLQYWLIAQTLGIGVGSWRFVGFFTILTNIGIALIATVIAFGARHRLAGDERS